MILQTPSEPSSTRIPLCTVDHVRQSQMTVPSQRVEIGFVGAAHWARPILGDFVKGRSGRYVTVRIAVFRNIIVPAYSTHETLH